MSRIFCGNLPNDIKEREVDDIFYKYGRIRDIHIVRRDRGAFAFVEYSDYRDAEDAVRGRDGYKFDGDYLKCEMSKDRRRDDRDGGRDGGRGDRGGGRDRDRGGDRGDRGERKPRERKPRERKPPPRSDYGVTITGLHDEARWKALKEHFATVGPVVFADIKENEGVVEFEKEDDMLEAIKKFDDTEYMEKTIGVKEAPPKPKEEPKEEEEESKPAETEGGDGDGDGEKDAAPAEDDDKKEED